MVGEKRLELLHLAILDPKSSASAIPPLALVNVRSLRRTADYQHIIGIRTGAGTAQEAFS